MHKVFKKEPVVVRDCFGFGLKEVTKTLYKHKLIDTSWKESSCSGGDSAMVLALKASKTAEKRGISMTEVPLMKEIIEYNEVDCKAVAEIVEYLRNNHI